MGIEILNYVDTVDQFFGLCVKIRELVRVELEVAVAARENFESRSTSHHSPKE